MRLANRYFDTIFDIDSDKVNTLIVENHKFFRACVCGMQNLCNKEDADFIFSVDHEEVVLGDKIELICDFINLDRNDKKLANGLVKFFTRAMADKSSEFAEYFARGYSLLNSISGELYPNVDFDEDIDHARFIKLFKPTFSYKDKDFLEKLLLYIDALVEFCDTKLIVMVNVKSYLNNEEFLELFKHARYMQVPIFCIESHETYKIKEEKIVIIDSDLCEIVK